jgi:bacillithiol biosynthesis cysteine-adding enzyme BshC
VAEELIVRSRLDFSRVPRTTALFRDYINSYQKVADFYTANPRHLEERLDSNQVLGKRDFPRQHLAEILKGQNQRLGCGPKTLANIELLRQPDALVVITGQQVGLFTGSLYTIYKALTVVQLTRELSERYPFRFLPLFWMASDDHDYAEVDHTALLDQANRLVNLRYEGHHRPGSPVGSLRLGSEIEPLVTQLDRALPESEFKDRVMDLIREAYNPTATLSEAFGRAMLSLFAEDGLVLVDPLEPSLRQLAAPILRAELKGAPRSAELVAQRGGRLANRGYHAQMRTTPGAANVFLLLEGRRIALIKEGESFRSKKGEQAFSSEELLDLLEESPERFGPNAALRPVVQDYLFPVVAYVAGPAEIAYFAQLGDVYELFGVPMPTIYPRISLTLMEARVYELLEKFGLGLEEVLVEEGRLIGQVVGHQMPGDLEELFDTSRWRIRDIFQALSEKVIAFEPTLEGYLHSAAGKVEHHLEAVRRKLLQARRARDTLLREQVSKISHHLFPAGQLQERVLNIFPFLARHGLEIIPQLETVCREPWEHLAIEIGR